MVEFQTRTVISVGRNNVPEDTKFGNELFGLRLSRINHACSCSSELKTSALSFKPRTLHTMQTNDELSSEGSCKLKSKCHVQKGTEEWRCKTDHCLVRCLSFLGLFSLTWTFSLGCSEVSSHCSQRTPNFWFKKQKGGQQFCVPAAPAAHAADEPSQPTHVRHC